MKMTIAKPQYAGASDEDVLKVISDPKSNPRLAGELMRILDAYSENCAVYIKKFGTLPESITHGTPPTALERRALLMVQEAMAVKGKKKSVKK